LQSEAGDYARVRFAVNTASTSCAIESCLACVSDRVSYRVLLPIAWVATHNLSGQTGVARWTNGPEQSRKPMSVRIRNSAIGESVKSPTTLAGSAPTSYPSLRNRVAFVTGGATGIGAEIVSALTGQGARVAFVDINEAAGRLLARQLADAGQVAPWWRVCDVRDIVALQTAVTDAATELGDFAVLVNNVASDDRHSLDSVTPAYYDERMAVNERPAFFAIQSVIPGMKRLGFGSIINLGSTGWQTKGAGYPCYAIAKSSVNGLTRGLAVVLGKDRIRINTVSPGWVMTERQVRLWLDAEGERTLQRNQCLPDRLKARDIANMVLFLASDDAAMCTAQEFKVDAGWS
jgi:NAD(P)-dependent dehydrogenase (short-subunit alcohol dehydrogenase family)